MRILHVATLVSPDGAYGGPVRVATNQLAELKRLGHEVKLVSGTSGYATRPASVAGIPADLFPVVRRIPGAGFAGLTAPGLTEHLRRIAGDYDVAHIHVARDLITLPAVRALDRAGVPFVLQPHGMIVESRNPLAPILDALITRRSLKHAHSVLSLTEDEAHALAAVSRGGALITPIRNGVPEQLLPQERKGRETVVFLARLQSRKRPLDFVEMARLLSDKHPKVDFILYGPDEGEGSAVAAAIAQAGLQERVSWRGPVPPEDTIARLRECTIYVLPSVNEVFPMSVLEAMSLGRAVVITESNGLARLLSDADAAVVVSPGAASLAAAVDKLLADPARRAAIGRTAFAVVESEFGMRSVAEKLIEQYEAAVESTSRRRT